MKKQWTRNLAHLFPVLFLAIILWPMDSVQAQEVGKVYDKTNYEEIKHLLIPAMENGVKNGEWLLKIGKLNFPLKHPDMFIDASKANAGKYGLDEDGHLMDPNTGKFPAYNVFGLPFPNIDPKDPKAAEKIIWNFNFQKYHFTSFVNDGTELNLVDTKTRHRLLQGTSSMLFWQGRMPGKAIENPKGYISSDITLNKSPMDMKGVAMLSFEFTDPKKDTIIYSYVPAIRRVRQLTGTARSDKVFGSDGCLDFYMMFAGKIATFKWRFLGERETLANFVKADKDIARINADGSMQMVMYQNRFGYDTPGSKGVAWAPTESIWIPRPVWIIEGASRDPYYNFGKQIFYVDKELYIMWQHEDFDRSGAFWQWITYCTHLNESPDGSLSALGWDYNVIIDEKIKHASISNYTPKSGGSRYYVPSETIGAKFFTVQTMTRLSK